MLEKLSDYFRSPANKGYLQKVYLGEQLREKIEKEFGIKCRVVVRKTTISIYCLHQAEAQSLNLKRRAIIRSMLGIKGYDLKIRVQPS